MAPRGRRTNLAELAGSVGENSPVDRDRAVTTDGTPHTVPLTDLTPNPRNPREDVGDLSGLASIAEMQLQPAVVVTRSAYLALYPDDDIDARYVVVNGCRRLAAAHKYGRDDLAIVVNNEIARDRVTLISASIAENVDRQDFDVIEEARAVEALVTECGHAGKAARRLHRTDAWVSQRRALLKLAPELQSALRRGELAIREARSLARVPLEEQVTRWRAALERNDNSGDKETDQTGTRPPTKSKVLTSALNDFGAQPHLLADALRTYLGDRGVQTLVALLGAQG
ncbi:ParB/RepB/Spo0J family partition protein [Mycolicibacterium sp. CBMA 226]|uniref:ParB/RepB/Spo0J family partition protein n=1 Tax=Mycolicibacterium sp. CBMA 226 TaxID=2606611 RepID=UPI0012DF7171|nr:ParB/RepB/Spo0J family partition protein [Mycolicibacterium sp. CBMA 226]MUL78935.1 ParB/RepB/Spo0J family partition protein [Mycolicibacterium sp. CBMA 226]QGW61242.1 Chromosome-partitioning protein Spo0J [Mycolicibacterium sp.]